MNISHNDYTILMNRCLQSKNNLEKIESLKNLHTAIQNNLPNPKRSINNEIQHFKLLLSDSSFHRLDVLNCLLDYVKTNLDDDSFINFYSTLHEDFFRLLFHTQAYDYGYKIIKYIIENHTSKKYIINIILNKIAKSIEICNLNGDVEMIIPYSLLLERIILDHNSPLVPSFITLLSSIKHDDIKESINNTINRLKMYISKLSDQVNESTLFDDNIYSMLKNFQFAISHPGNIDSNYDFGRSIKVIISILDSSKSDDKLVSLCYDTIEKLAYVKMDERNQFKLFNYLLKSMNNGENSNKLSISKCLSRILCNYDIRIFREFLNYVHDQRISNNTAKAVLSALNQFVAQNTPESNRLLFDAIEYFSRLSSRNDLIYDHIYRLYNTLRDLLKLPDRFSMSPGSTLAKSLSLSDFGDDSTNAPLSKVKIPSQSTVKDIDDKNDLVLDITRFKSTSGTRPLLINLVDNNSSDYSKSVLSCILELRSKFVSLLSQDLFNCMFDIDHAHYEKMSLEASKFWANYIQQDSSSVRNLIFLQDDLFHSILVWFYRILSYRDNSSDIALTCIIFIMSGISMISSIINDRKLLQNENLYIFKILYYIMDRRILDINTIIDGGLGRIFIACIMISDKFSSFFNPFYTSLSDVSRDLSLDIFNIFQGIIFAQNSIIAPADINYLLDVKAQILSMAKDGLVEATSKFYNKLANLVECERIPTHITEFNSEFNVFSNELDDVNKNIIEFKNSVTEAKRMMISIQNYSLNCDDLGEKGFGETGISQDKGFESRDHSTYHSLSDTLHYIGSMEYSLRGMRSESGISVYDTLTEQLTMLSGYINYMPDESKLLLYPDSIKLVYNRLLGKSSSDGTSNASCTSSFYSVKKQVNISEFIPILKDSAINIDILKRIDFRSMQLLMRMYIYLWYRLTNSEDIATWEFISANLSNWPIELISLAIRSILRDIDQAYSNLRRRKHPLDGFRIKLFKILSEIFINKNKHFHDKHFPVKGIHDKDSFHDKGVHDKYFNVKGILQLKYSLYVIRYDLSKLDDVEVDEIINIIQDLDDNIGVDIDFMSNDTEHNVNTIGLGIENNDKIKMLKSYISELKICNLKSHRN